MTAARLTGALILAAIGASWLVSLASGYDIVADVDPTRASALPSAAHWLGTDHLGRDVGLRLLTASQAFVGPALLAAAVSLSLSVPAGTLAGWLGGIPAAGLRYIGAVTSALPRFVLVLLACAAYGDHPIVLAAAAGLAYAPTMTEAIYARVRELRRADFVLASRAHGLSDARVLGYHLLWVNVGPVMRRHLLHLLATVILLETTLSYLGGFGVEEPQPSWGNMLAFSFTDAANPFAWAAPAAAIWLALFGLALLSSGPTPARATPPAPAAPTRADRLSVRDLRVLSGDGVLLDGVTFSLSRGEIVALVGASGAGKSLTARACLGLLDPSLSPGIVSGDVAAPAGGLGYLPQDALASLDPLWTVRRQLAEVIALSGEEPDDERLRRWLRRVGFTDTDGVLALYPHQLSGGMAQRVCTALLLARGCRFLLADEPTSSLDPSVARTLLDGLRQLRSEGVGILLITHDLRLVPPLADRVLVMHEGRIIERLSADALAAASHPETCKLLQATARVGAGLLPVAAPKRPAPAEALVGVPRPVLRLRGLVHHHRTGLLRRPTRLPAIDGVDLDLFAGEVVGLIGESGAGKSTLALAAAGLLRPTRGIVEVAGADPRGRRSVQLLLQSAAAHLNPGLRLDQILTESARLHRPDTPAGPLVEAALARAGLSARARARPDELSGGEQRRAGIAQLLLTRPQLVIADEPAAGLDAAMKAAQLDELLTLRGPETGILLISHDLPMISYAADRIVVMVAGRLLESAPAEALLSGPHHPYTWSLLAAAGLETPEQMSPLIGESVGRTSRGCPYRGACPLASPACEAIRPLPIEVGRRHTIACHAPEARA